MIFDTHGCDSILNERSGQHCTIIRRLTAEEADEEVGPMFEIEFDDGFRCDAFEDELFNSMDWEVHGLEEEGISEETGE